MSRPLRIEFPGALYHVMNRGNQKQDVFRKKADCEAFMEKLEYFSGLFDVEVYCYVLMNNHFHLLLKTNEANLGRFMQSFLTSFTLTLNKRNNRSGHLFQGRYKAHLVESREYISKLSQYIHLNPIRIQKYSKLSIEEKRNILLNYTWSSFPVYIGQREVETFLDIEDILSTWGTNIIQKMKNYRVYVEEGLFKDIDNPFDLAIRQQIIGSESYAERITRSILLKQSIKNRKEESALAAFQHSLKPELVIAKVAEYFNVPAETILRRRSQEKIARAVVIYLCSIYCNSRMTLTEIGKIFSLSLSGLTRTRDRVKEKLVVGDKELVKIISKIKKSIAEV